MSGLNRQGSGSIPENGLGVVQNLVTSLLMKTPPSTIFLAYFSINFRKMSVCMLRKILETLDVHTLTRIRNSMLGY